MYKVVKGFYDLEDSKKTKTGTIYHAYEVGDVYPRKGLKPSKARIDELLGSDNKQNTPLIKLVEDEKAAKKEAIVNKNEVNTSDK